MARNRPAKWTNARGLRDAGAVWIARLAWLALIIGLLSILAGSALAQPGTPAPLVVRESRFEIADAPAVAEVVQQVVNFPAGAWTSPHSHGGQAINLVLEGEITFRQGGGNEGDGERKYRAGEAWFDPTETVHAAGNDTQSPAHLLTNFLLPAGSTQTTTQGNSDLEPQVAYQARFPVAALPADAEVVQQATDFAPGAWTGPVKHGGQAVHIVVFGEVTYRADGQPRVFKAGEAWEYATGHPYAAGNMGSYPVRLFTTVLLPEGAELTEPADAVAVPHAQAPEREEVSIGVVALVVVITAGVLALAGAGFLLLRRSRTTG